MSFVRFSRTLLAAAALATLAACAAPGFRANVARFQQMPAPQGQTFSIAPKDPALQGSLEFAHYADLVAARMTQLGYVRAAGATSDFTVRVDYDVDRGRERIVNDGFADPFWGPGYGYGGFYGRPPIIRSRRGFHYAFGWYDPFLFGGGFGGGGARSYTIYTSNLGVTIERSGTSERLFEGTAEAMSNSNDLTRLVPNLVDALFTDFPGNSGERVRITVAGQDTRR
jgi:hypothetical protein